MSEESDQVGQDEIEQLLKQAQDAAADAGGGPPAGGAPAEPEAAPPAPTEEAANADSGLGELDQSDIERLLNGGGDSPAAEAPAPAATATTPSQAAAGQAGHESVAKSDIELLLNKAQDALASIDEAPGAMPEGVQAFELHDFSGTAANKDSATLELMRDVQLDLTIELGRTHMHLEDVLKLKRGAVVPLDKLAGDPADIYVNGRLVARGEVLVLNDNFCVRVAELIVGESACA
ncbi:MAG: flagellar motor switch protein FliN [Planctomycetota bacterium]